MNYGTCAIHGTPVMEMIFDATDLHANFYCLMINVFTPLRDSMAEWLAKPSFRQVLLKSKVFDIRFLPLLLQSLNIEPDGHYLT
jgi:hypothetical protein